jgi:hypothetical protein
MAKETENTQFPKTNHINITISKSRVDDYLLLKKLSEELNCSLGELCWYGIDLLMKEENRPKKFGFIS